MADAGPALLRASGIAKRFGGVVALDGAEFDLRAGEVHALVGSNGCGKSTLAKIIAGAVGADGGSVLLEDRPVAFAGPAEAASEGIVTFYQELSLIPQMTVAENIFLGREPLTAIGLVDRRALRQAAGTAIQEFAEALSAGVDPDDLVAELSADERQIVEILKVLGLRSRIVIFDEATAALDRNQVAVLFRHVRALKAQGRAIVFISHRLDEVLEIADRVTVMRNGLTVLTRTPAELTRDQIVEAMVGQLGAPQEAKARHAATAEIALEAEGLDADKLTGVSFKLRRGEILGLGGLHGQGQSQLLRSLFGISPIRHGRVLLGGKPFVPKSPLAVLRKSMAYISGDRARHGVMAIRPIFENLVVSLLVRDRRFAVPRRRLEGELGPIVERLKLKFASFAAPVAQLSGGNQQKVVIGRLLATQPSILLLDDPTKGIDLRTKRDLYAIMDDLCAHGVSILLYSSDDEELLGVADRVLVFDAGRIVAELAGEERNQLALYRAAYAAGRSHAA
ncbi:MAG TPA: sugar ABC transporter ATP-binding protein [Candidatus Udaeobacter sp.]|nr:sugar ABC transporter ATP-binding protein [Candidatus Udaeobacter sp.]